MWIEQSDKVGSRKPKKKAAVADVSNIRFNPRAVPVKTTRFVKTIPIEVNAFYTFGNFVFRVTSVRKNVVFFDRLDERLQPEAMYSGSSGYRLNKKDFMWDYTKAAGPIPTKEEVVAMTKVSLGD